MLVQPDLSAFVNHLCGLTFEKHLQLHALIFPQQFHAWALLAPSPICNMSCSCPTCGFLHAVALMLIPLELDFPLTETVLTAEQVEPLKERLWQALLCTIIHLGHVPFLFSSAYVWSMAG